MSFESLDGALDFLRDGNSTLSLAEGIDTNISGKPSFRPIGQQERRSSPAQVTTIGAEWWTDSWQPVLPGLGTDRPLWKPNEAMREIHRRVLAFADARDWMIDLRFESPRDSHFGWQHQNRGHYFYLVDLKNAFQSVGPRRLAEILAADDVLQPLWGKTAEDVENMLARYFIAPTGGLVQGGPASPYLFARYMRDFDQCFPLQEQHRHSIHYSRYVDDLLFSSHRPIGKRKRAQIKDIIRAGGFEVNPRKTRAFVLNKQAAVVNGVGIRMTRGGLRTFLPRRELARIQGILHAAIRGQKVNPALVHGLMGRFYSVTDPFEGLNATEKRLVNAYESFRRRTF